MISTRFVVNLFGLVAFAFVVFAAVLFLAFREASGPTLMLLFAVNFFQTALFVYVTQKEEQIVIRVRRAGKPPLRRD